MKKSSPFSLFLIMLTLGLSLTVTGVFATWYYFLNQVTLSQNVSLGMGNFYYDIAVIDVSLVSKTAIQETSTRDFPLGAHSVMTGNNGQKAVYQITARNYSPSVTYVYSGATVTAGQASLSTSADEDDQSKLPVLTNATYTAGTPIYPGDTFTFYATYTLTGNITDGEILTQFHFLPVLYSVTYMDDNQVYAIDCITGDQEPYTVRSDHPPVSGSGVKFEYWMNASGLKVTSYPANNRNNYTLNAKWNNIYSIIFVDADGSVIHQEHITKETTELSAQGKATVDAKLAQLQAAVDGQDISVSWSNYSFGNEEDIIVRAEYTYAGALWLDPIFDEGGVNDGILDYYVVRPLDTLTGEEHKSIVIPGKVGAPVRTVERVTNQAGKDDWNNFNNSIETITIGEGVERLEWNSLSYTPKLHTVYLPNSLQYMGKNTFSRNTPSDNKKRGHDGRMGAPCCSQRRFVGWWPEG